MSSITIRINTDNAAFDPDDDPSPEIARILRVAANRLENRSADIWPMVLRDINGNRVGTATWDED